MRLRRDYNTPTIEPKIYGEKLCNIYRLHTIKENTLINNQNEFNADINRLNTLRARLKEILNGKDKNETQNQSDREIWDDYISFIKTEAKQVLPTTYGN